MKRALLLMPLLVGCEVTLPGEHVATFDVTLTLEENTCGEQAVYLTDGQTFAAEIRKDDQRSYWRTPDQKSLDGSYDGKAYKFVTASVVASEMPCSLFQTATMTAKLAAAEVDAGADQEEDAGNRETDAGVGQLALSGDYVLVIEALSGTDCRGALMPSGPFKALPCTVRYDVSGVERDEF